MEGCYHFAVEEQVGGEPVELLLTENETDKIRINSDNLHQTGNSQPGKKGALNNYVVHGTGVTEISCCFVEGVKKCQDRLLCSVILHGIIRALFHDRYGRNGDQN